MVRFGSRHVYSTGMRLWNCMAPLAKQCHGVQRRRPGPVLLVLIPGYVSSPACPAVRTKGSGLGRRELPSLCRQRHRGSGWPSPLLLTPVLLLWVAVSRSAEEASRIALHISGRGVGA